MQRRKYLVVRRDNIGDLVLTTPLIHALRQHQPDAWIGALVNSYNAPVLRGNPDLDAVFAYDKAKHRRSQSRFAVYRHTLRLLLQLRSMQIDTVILAGPGAQHQAYGMARWLKAGAVLGFTTPGFAPAGITVPVAYGNGAALHETADIFRLLAPLGIDANTPIPPCSVRADAALVNPLRARVIATLGERQRGPQLPSASPSSSQPQPQPQRQPPSQPQPQPPSQPQPHSGPLPRPWIGIQISARRVKQRWPVARFAALMQQLHATQGAVFLLFWSPGAADDARHPGDDARARELIDELPENFPVFACASSDLPSLIAGLALTGAVITPDGGAMHLAAALGKPVVALFGDSPVTRWRPWGVAHEVVQAASGDVADVPVSDVVAAWNRLAPRVSMA